MQHEFLFEVESTMQAFREIKQRAESFYESEFKPNSIGVKDKKYTPIKVVCDFFN
jgi:hypothetical protein